MKKAVSLLLAILLFNTLCLTGCDSSGHGLEEVSSYMLDDETVEITFRNESNKTITYVSGNLNLFTGSASSQTPFKSPSFTWEGTCEKGDTFTVTVNVYDAPLGLAEMVNRIGFHIDEVR